jgi:hypothetical protein
MRRGRGGGRRARWRPAVVTLGAWLAVVAPTRAVKAQERLLGTRTVGGSGYVETINFGGDGVPQRAFAGSDSVRVTQATQFLLPVAVTTSLGERWRLDLTAFYARGQVQYADDTRGGAMGTAALEGISDTRLRLTGSHFSEAVTFTVGLNLPTGRSSLTPTQFAALRVLVAPALGMGSPPVGAGASGTVGAVYGTRAGPWSLAFGGSYEYRGSYQPVAALVAGAPSADFQPGGVIRASVGGERLVGPHRLTAAASVDVFSDDRLRTSAFSGDTAAQVPAEARVRLGPVISGDLQLLLAPGRLRELIVYSSYLWRAAYARDGRTAAGSSGHYAAGGLRGAIPVATRLDVVLAGEGRWQSGLEINEGLPTAGVRAATVTVGLSTRRAMLTIQPYLRAQLGTLRERGAAGGPISRSFSGVAAGIVLISRL